MQQHDPTPGRGWIILLGVLAGAYIGLQEGDCDGCMVPNLYAMLLGAALGGILVAVTLP